MCSCRWLSISAESSRSARGGSEDAEQPHEPGAQRFHASSSSSSLAARKRVMIAEVVSHCLVSRSICFRPALVSL